MTKKQSILLLKVFLYFGILIGMSSCVSVKEYQKMYLNDPEMALQSRKVELYEINLASYREGAAGANGGKVGGGCGCN